MVRMPALATAAKPRPEPGSYVSAEWRGRARTLRSRIADAHSRWEAAAFTLTAPLCARGNFVPAFTKGSLRLTEARWKALPRAWGRLRLVAQNDGDRLSIAEFRMVDFRTRMAAWNGDELGLAIALVSATMALPSSFNFSSKTLALVSLHALGRRYGRGADRSDLAVVRDLLPLAVAAPAALAGNREFAIAAGDGRWIGARMALDGQTVAAIKTYVE
jgi:hypothetical protein